MCLKSFRNVNLQLTLIILLGLIIRLAGAARAGIWYDEAVSLKLAAGSLSTIYEGLVSSLDNSPPFFNLFLHFWIRLFGLHPQFVVELPSVLAGVLTIWLIFNVGRRFFNERTAVIAALLLALSPYHVKYSQEIRPYAWAALFVLLSFYFFYNYLQGERKTPWGYYITTILALYTHNLVVLPFFCQTVWLIAHLIRRKITLRDFCRLSLPVALVYLPWLIVTFIQTALVTASADNWMGPLTWQKVFRFLERISFNDGIKSRIFTIVALIPYLFAFARGLASEPKKARNLLYVYLFGPTALLILLSLTLRPLFIHRYLFFVLPAYILLLSEGLSCFSKSIQRYLLLGLMVLISLTSLVFDYQFPSSPHAKYTESFIKQNYRSGDAFIFFDIMSYMGGSYYAASKYPVFIYRPSRRKSELIPENECFSHLDQLSGFSRLWIIEPQDNAPDWRTILEASTENLTTFTVPKMRKGCQIKAIHLMIIKKNLRKNMNRVEKN